MKFFLPLICVLGFVVAAQGNIFCDSCHIVIGFLEKEFNENGGVIEQDANKICDKVTFKNSVLDPICHKILDGQIEEIEKLLKEGKDAQHICQAIKFCH
uniref:Saposin B-type domain-containing protein n=1 Tax=Steinernema glaseri TaxID=37863 RepID=A0A1I8ATY4_9BILA